MVTELEKDNLSEIISENEAVIVQYSAGWCGNCKIMKPKFRKLAAETDGVKFVIADAEKFPESRKLAKVDNLPTFAVFRNGNFVSQVQTNKVDNVIGLLNEITNN